MLESWRPPLLCLAALLILAPGADDVLAQRPPETQVQGRLIDDTTDEPIPGADVLLLDAFDELRARRTTDEFGRFTFQIRSHVGIRFRAERIGYHEVTTPILHLEEREFFSVEIRMDPDAVLLAPLEVVARSPSERSPIFSNFDHRVERGFGVYFTRDQIEEIQPVFVSDVIASVPGVRLEGSGRGGQRTISMARTAAAPGPGGGLCRAQIYVDGRLVNRSSGGQISIDDVVTPEMVEGIEVYRGLSTVPAEFMTPEARCGVVAVWTRRGG